MNLKYLLFSTLLVMSFLSCSKDEEEQVKVSSSAIAGLWKLSSVSCTDGTTTVESGGSTLNQSFTVTGKDYDATVTLSENPNVYKSEGSYTAVSVVTFNGSTYIQETPFQDFTVTGNWKLDGNKLLVTSNGQPEQSAEIVKLDANNLEYKVLVNQVVIENEAKLTSKGTYFFKLTR